MTDGECDPIRVADVRDGDGAEILDESAGAHLSLDERGIVHTEAQTDLGRWSDE